MQLALALWRQFEVNSDALECAKVFKYLGCMLSMHDDDAHTVHIKLTKARACWNCIAKVLSS